VSRLSTLRRDLTVRWRVANDLTPPDPRAFAAFGEGSWIVPPARVTRPDCIEIGAGVVLLEHAWLSVVQTDPDAPPLLRIGDRVRFGRCSSIACVGSVVIGDDVMASDAVFVADCYHAYEDPTRPVRLQGMSTPEPVIVEPGAYLGAGAIVLPGVTIGERAYVGEAAVVVRDVAPRTVVFGNPARVVRRFDEDAAAWIGAPLP
jgi:acetyltransferase-like isoleucine patch superfamily enzyme